MVSGWMEGGWMEYCCTDLLSGVTFLRGGGGGVGLGGGEGVGGGGDGGGAWRGGGFS